VPVDPSHEIVVLLVLVAFYGTLGAAVWVFVCSRGNSAVRKLNAAVAARQGSVFTIGATGEAAPDLAATLAALVAEKRISPKLAKRLKRVAPVFHEGRWVVYPSNAYWSHRFERLRSRRAS